MNIELQRLKSACPYCCQQEGALLSNKDAKTGKYLAVYVCSGCGLTRVDPLPTEDELAEYYRDEYRLDYKGQYEPKLKHVARAGSNALSRYTRVRDFIRVGSRCLDIGAGGGEFVYLMHCQGFKVTGIEPNEGYSNFARKEYGIDIRTGGLDSALLSDEKYDFISMFHVLEHLLNPLDVFEKIHHLLNDGGMYYLEVPNVNALGNSPGNFFFRAHLYYFSPQIVEAIAEKAGFQLVTNCTLPASGNMNLLFKKISSNNSRAMHHSTKEIFRETLEMNNKRTWLHYLFAGQGLTTLKHRLGSRRQERYYASRYKSAKSLLDELYSKNIM